MTDATVIGEEKQIEAQIEQHESEEREEWRIEQAEWQTALERLSRIESQISQLSSQLQAAPAPAETAPELVINQTPEPGPEAVPGKASQRRKRKFQLRHRQK